MFGEDALESAYELRLGVVKLALDVAKIGTVGLCCFWFWGGGRTGGRDDG
jgi:hypothetical protein